MSGTRRQCTSLPYTRIASKLELNRPTLDHDIRMLNPILIPWLAVDLHRLDIVTIRIVKIIRRDPQGPIIIDSHIDIREPRGFEQVNRLRDDRIETEHLPDEPRIQRTSIAISGHTVVGVVEELVGEGARPLDRFPLFSDVIIQVWRCKVRLVSYVHDGRDSSSVCPEILLARAGLELIAIVNLWFCGTALGLTM